MTKPDAPEDSQKYKLALNLAIVGGGRACKFFLELLKETTLPLLDINLVGVCDINPEARGFLLAKQMGLYTTTDFRDLFKIEKLDGIIELTNSSTVLMELVRYRPKQVAILEHNISRLVRNLFLINQQLQSAEHQVLMEKLVTDFLIQQAKQRIVVLNTDYTIADANEACLRSINRSKSEVIGAHCYEMINQQQAPCSVSHTGFECPMLEAMRTGEPANAVHEDRSAAGQNRYSDIIAYPIKDADGQVVRVIEIWRDITKALEHRWNQRVEAFKSDLKKLIQEDRMISLGKLVASCVHEINNPIQGLLTFGHLMRDMLETRELAAENQPRMKEFVDLMCSELDRCGHIVSGLQSFSRESPTAYRDVELNDILKTVIRLIRHKAELQNIELSVDLTPALLTVHGDTNLLQQCFMNLLFNSLEAMPTQGTLTIISRIDEAQEKAMIHIEDTGCGIDESDLGLIFDPFFTTKPTGEGTGLGLSIVYGAVKGHQGSIDVHSRIHQGTRFTLSFPLN